ncbi:uncharacterized protein LOC116798121 [Chiroxiphia lanceolata]|uniref:uncharacterized protein LOC116798121 n=1 Tax=Chiroxiphia lanceolata TaxID=296741 RepID=UPI0013CEE553|nr:uncharacterized protein LOC116798121 [Chiroxiphia lanceolata]
MGDQTHPHPPLPPQFRIQQQDLPTAQTLPAWIRFSLPSRIQPAGPSSLPSPAGAGGGEQAVLRGRGWNGDEEARTRGAGPWEVAGVCPHQRMLEKNRPGTCSKPHGGRNRLPGWSKRRINTRSPGWRAPGKPGTRLLRDHQPHTGWFVPEDSRLWHQSLGKCLPGAGMDISPGVDPVHPGERWIEWAAETQRTGMEGWESRIRLGAPLWIRKVTFPPKDVNNQNSVVHQICTTSYFPFVCIYS